MSNALFCILATQLWCATDPNISAGFRMTMQLAWFILTLVFLFI